MKIERTGDMVAFLDISIGSPFFSHGKFWVRTAFEAATILVNTMDGLGASTCNFLIDGTTKPKHGPYSFAGEKCDAVEIVKVLADDVAGDVLPAAVLTTLADLRAAGWTVAIHNDYRQNDTPMTFWLMTHPSGLWVKGEGETDEAALAICAAQARKVFAPSP